MGYREDLFPHLSTTLDLIRSVCRAQDAPGSFITPQTPQSLVDWLLQQHFEATIHPLEPHAVLYTAHDAPIARRHYISRTLAKFLLDTQVLSPETPVHFSYEHGNVLTRLDYQEVDPKLLLTDTISILVHTDICSIISVTLGEHAPPNQLYTKLELDGRIAPLERVLKVDRIHRFEFFNLGKMDCVGG